MLPWRHPSGPLGLAAAIVAGLVLSAGAAAHGPFGGGVGYVSTVSGLQPPVLGAIANVLGGDDRLQLVNYTGKTIVVDGYEREPFLRFTTNGVYENVRSPAAYLSLQRDPAKAFVPADADARAKPVWRKVTEGSTFAWHDQRIHWVKRTLPPVIRQAPKQTHLIFHWSVPAHVGARPFAITGFLGYRPPASVLEGDGTDWLLVAAAIGAAALAAAAIGAGARRMTRRAP